MTLWHDARALDTLATQFVEYCLRKDTVAAAVASAGASLRRVRHVRHARRQLGTAPVVGLCRVASTRRTAASAVDTR